MGVTFNPFTGNFDIVSGNGSQGETGLPGLSGATGPAGSNGTNGETGPQGLNGTNGVSPQLLSYNSVYIYSPSDNLDGTYTIKLYFAEGNLPYFLSPGCTIYDSLSKSYKVISYDTVLYPNGNSAFQDGGNVIISGSALPTQDTDFNSKIWTVIDGATGIQGLQGSQGETGLPGYVGSDGVTGPIGMTGANGINGSTGPAGAEGTQGVTGIVGANGIQGVTGLNGIDGSTGPIGVTGGFYGPTGIFSGVVTAGLDVSGNLVNLNTQGATGVPGGFTYNYVGVSLATPTMTGFTGPSNWTYSDTQYNANRVAWKAFNNTTSADLDDSWESDGSAFPHWIAYKFTTPTLISQYAIAPRAFDGTYYPKTWKFQGSTDGSIWVDLDSRTNITSWTAYTFNYYTATNSTAYQYYRLYITAGSDANYVTIQEIKLLSPGAAVPLGVLQYNGSLTSKWQCGGDTGPSEIITANHAQSMINKQSISGVTGIFSGSLGVGGRSMMTPEGGFCIALTAQHHMKRGTIVQASTTAANSISINPIDGVMPIGTIYGNAATNGTTAIASNLAWVTIAGIGYITMGATGLSGQVAYSSNGATGTADASSTIPAQTTHDRELGHLIGSTGPGGLNKIVHHFN